MTAMNALVDFTRKRLLAELETIGANPISVSDDSTTRVVQVLESIEYGFDRKEKSFFSNLREPDGTWRHVPATDTSSVIFDTYLPMRPWRRRIVYTLRLRAYQSLVELANQVGDAMHDDHDINVHRLSNDIVDAAWCGLHMRAHLRERFGTKVIRHEIREVLAVDDCLLALARAARFRCRYKALTQQWLSFVWQHQEVLDRIWAQTPTLLTTVAEHMYGHGVNPAIDPTKACVMWLIANGVSKRSYRLLTKHSARPFRSVTARFTADQVLDALVLALSMTARGHDARIPRPLFYRITMDEFGPTMTAARIRERFAAVPQRVFAEASQRLDAAVGYDALHDAALEYRTISAWWVVCNPDEHAEASWQRWLGLAHAEEARQRISTETSSWPCALEELRTPTAEVLALSTPLGLFEEGRALRHCAFSYVFRCHIDQVRFFSASMRHEGRTERATIGLQHGPRGWRIWDIRGACNRRMGGHWIALARQVAEAYTHRDGSGQLPLPLLHGLGVDQLLHDHERSVQR